MTERTTLRLDQHEEERQRTLRRYAVLVLSVIGLLLLAVSIPSLVTLKPQVNSEYIGNLLTASMGLISLVSAWLSYRYNTTRGSLLFITSILLLSLGAPIYAHGLGLQTGLIVAIIVAGIAATTLPQQSAARATILGFAVGFVVIVLDLFLPDIGLGTYQSPNATYFLIVILFLFGFFVFRRLNSYTLRTKLILFFVTLAALSIATSANVINTLSRAQITRQVGKTQLILAEQLAFETGQELESQIDSLITTSIQFEKIAEEKTNSYSGVNNEILDQIKSRDQEWLTATDQTGLIQNVLFNKTSDELRKFRDLYPNHVELFLTDAYGANIAATNKTTDYYQADEDWWKLAYNQGKGRVFISQPEFDVSSQTYGVLMAVPIYTNGEVVGILRSTYNIAAIFENLEHSNFIGTEEFDLRFANDAQIDPDEILGLRTVMEGFGEIQYKGKPSLVSQHPVFSPQNALAGVAISDLGWSIIVHQDLDEALQPVTQQTRVIILAALIITMLAGGLAIVASQILAAPITTLTAVIRKISEGDIAVRAEASTQDEIGELANSFNRMTSRLQDTLGSLERRVAERTLDVETARLMSERRAQDLQSISDISRIITTEQKLEVLLPLITRLVSERFDFYHVGIFFVDSTKQFAIIQATNSEGGKRMLARSHRLETGTGIVGTVVQTGQPRIALDVGADAVYFDNPDLPETRSEMALPLNFRGATIGILDVQSTKQGAFTSADASTLGILADQIAIAIENARLFGQAVEAREEAENLYNQFLRKEWKIFLQQEPNFGYRQSTIGGKPLKQPVETDEINQALSEGKVVVVQGNEAKALPAIAIPVQLHGQTIGILNIKSPVKHRKWNQDEINLAQAISNRLALALENARLLQESQRYAAKEAKIGEMTTRIGASINMRNVLQTAVEELGRALPGSEVVIQFQSPEEK